MVGEKEKKRKKSRAGKGGPASVSSLQPPLSVGDVTVNPLSAPPSPPLLPLSPDTPIHAAAIFTRPLPHSPGVLSATSHELNAFSVPLCLGEREAVRSPSLRASDTGKEGNLSFLRKKENIKPIARVEQRKMKMAPDFSVQRARLMYSREDEDEEEGGKKNSTFAVERNF